MRLKLLASAIVVAALSAVPAAAEHEYTETCVAAMGEAVCVFTDRDQVPPFTADFVGAYYAGSAGFVYAYAGREADVAGYSGQGACAGMYGDSGEDDACVVVFTFGDGTAAVLVFDAAQGICTWIYADGSTEDC